MIVAVYTPSPERIRHWIQLLARLLPEFDVQAAENISDPNAVFYAVVWKPPIGMLARWPQLKATISIGSGIDHVLADTAYPEGVPILKTQGPAMIQRMCEYVSLHVLRYHRLLPDIEASQRRRVWEQPITPLAQNRVVGVMGLGNIGTEVARCLAQTGFRTRGWSLSGRPVEGVEVFNENGLDTFLAGTEILVCLLPLTSRTDGILNKSLFGKLQHGACLINVARGAHLVEEDLLDALASMQLARATLDVFRIEPLPADHPFWDHEQILVTPHIASLIDPETGAGVIAQNIRALTFPNSSQHSR